MNCSSIDVVFPFPKGTVSNLLHRQMPLLIAQLDKSIVEL